MAKRRKRTNKNVPAKGRLRDMADRLWSLAVRDDWGYKCAVCNGEPVEAHHLIPRSNYEFRYDLRNAVALCTRHHVYDPAVSPHQNAAGWLEWLEHNHPERLKWYREHHHQVFTGTTSAIYFCDVLADLRQYVDDSDWDRIVGIKFGRYLLEELQDVD